MFYLGISYLILLTHILFEDMLMVGVTCSRIRHVLVMYADGAFPVPGRYRRSG